MIEWQGHNPLQLKEFQYPECMEFSFDVVLHEQLRIYHSNNKKYKRNIAMKNNLLAILTFYDFEQINVIILNNSWFVTYHYIINMFMLLYKHYAT